MGLAGNRRTTELLDAIIDYNCASALTVFSELWQNGKAPATLLGELGTLIRDILMLIVPQAAERSFLAEPAI